MRRSRDFWWAGRAGTAFEKRLTFRWPLHETAHAPCLAAPIASPLPHGDQSRVSAGGTWGSGFQSRHWACEIRTVQRISAQRWQDSGAGTWRVGGFEFGHLLQCGGGDAGREACNVPRGWTTGSSSAPRWSLSPPGSWVEYSSVHKILKDLQTLDGNRGTWGSKLWIPFGWAIKSSTDKSAGNGFITVK